MVFNILKSKKAEGSVSTAIKVVISVVLGSLVLLGAISLIDTTIGPALNNTLNTQQDEEITNPIDLTNPIMVTYGLGDVNQDRSVNENDIEYFTRFVNGWEGYNVLKEQGDVNGDSLIDLNDLYEIKNMVAFNNLNHSGIIPKNATYTVRSTGEVLNAGDSFPETVGNLDIYRYKDYTYIYNGQIQSALSGQSVDEIAGFVDISGWNVTVFDNQSKTSYGSILESINGKSITGMISTFYLGGQNIVEPPKIPDTVIYMNNTFSFCSQLSRIPEIPEGVTNMDSTFVQCGKIFEQNVTLPKTVLNIDSAFLSCGISGILKVPCTASPTDKSSIFGPYEASQTVEVYHYEGCGH